MLGSKQKQAETEGEDEDGMAWEHEGGQMPGLNVPYSSEHPPLILLPSPTAQLLPVNREIVLMPFVPT